MPFYERGDVRIHYDEVGSGFPLLVTPGGGLNSRMSNWPSAVINAMEVFKDDFRCITMDQRNANGGDSTGPLAVDDPWGGFADDQLGLMDHLGIGEFIFMGYCIGGCFAGTLLDRAPGRVAAAVFCQTVGHRPEDPDVMYRSGRDGWAPGLLAERPDLTQDAIDRYLHNLYRTNPDFLYSVSRDVIAQLPDAGPRAAGRQPGPPAPDLGGRRLAGSERRDHGLPVDVSVRAEGTHDRTCAPIHSQARRGAVKADKHRHPGPVSVLAAAPDRGRGQAPAVERGIHRLRRHRVSGMDPRSGPG